MKKKVFDIIGLIIISLVIVIFNLIIGANEKGLRILPMTILLALMLIYLIIRKIVFKQKIVIKNKVDIFMLLFIISTTLPYIFKTYCTLQGTIEFIMKYFFVYAVYLTIRNTVDTKKKVNILILITLISSLIIVVLGIDRQNNQHFDWLLARLNLRYTDNTVLFSTFGYANTVAIYFSFCIFLAINQIQNTNKKIVKILYSIYLIIGFYTVYNTICRSVFIMLIASIFMYFTLINIKRFKKHKRKLICIAILLFVFITLITTFIFTIGIKVSKPYEFDDRVWQRNFEYPFEKNKSYVMELHLETKNNSMYSGENFEIIILEINEYFNQKILGTKKLGDFDGVQYIEFTTTENLYTVDILINNKYNGNVIIKKCYINNEECPMNYKYLPYQLGMAIDSYSLLDQSILQRIDMWQDCIRMAESSPIIGHGGNTWKNLSQTVQEYPYGMKESHSYFFELLISYGIVGVTLYLALIIIFNVKIIRECIKNKENIKYKISILIGLNLIILHSLFFDFDMSFVVILITVFGYIAMLMYDSKEEISEFKILDYITIMLFIVVLSIYILADIARYCVDDIKLKREIGFYIREYKCEYIDVCIYGNHDYKYTLNELQKIMKTEPYYYQMDIHVKYWSVLLKNLNNLSEEEVIEYVSFINENYKNVKHVAPMYISTILPRVKTMQNAVIKLTDMNYENEEIKKQIKELKQIIKSEYEENIINIRDKERNGEIQETIDRIENEYNKILESINLEVENQI